MVFNEEREREVDTDQTSDLLTLSLARIID